MAVIKTGAIFKTLRFGSVDSKDYGIYITGEAVYNAPERAVERVSVPGRNGDILIDQGRFENVPVRYPAGTFATSQSEFSTNIADFRNAILSQRGYQRLEDDYNPSEYRMANASAGFEVDPSAYGQAGEFELVFDCKPQRFLTSGETETTIAASGDTITNPTLFESQPLLKLDGYGKVGFNGYEVEVFNVPIGPVQISGADQQSTQIFGSEVPAWTYSYNKASFASGDTITVSGLSFILWIDPQVDSSFIHQTSGSGLAGVTNKRPADDKTNGREWVFPAVSFTVGTNGSASYVSVLDGTISPISGSTGYSVTPTVTMTATHDASAGTITFSIQSTLDVPTWNANHANNPITQQSAAVSVGSISGNSTKSSISDPVYIDCEIGEAYIIQGGEPVSVNNSVSIGADLPVLAPGSNTVTFDNTFTSVKITPRWWQL